MNNKTLCRIRGHDTTKNEPHTSKTNPNNGALKQIVFGVPPALRVEILRGDLQDIQILLLLLNATPFQIVQIFVFRRPSHAKKWTICATKVTLCQTWAVRSHHLDIPLHKACSRNHTLCSAKPHGPCQTQPINSLNLLSPRWAGPAALSHRAHTKKTHVASSVFRATFGTKRQQKETICEVQASAFQAVNGTSQALLLQFAGSNAHNRMRGQQTHAKNIACLVSFIQGKSSTLNNWEIGQESVFTSSGNSLYTSVDDEKKPWRASSFILIVWRLVVHDD